MGKANQWLKFPIGKRLRLLQSAGLRDDEWLEPALRYIPWKERTYNKTDWGNKPMICFPEERYYRSYLRMHPEALNEPVDLSSHEPPMARRYAWKIMSLIQQGVPPDEARATVTQQLQEYHDQQTALRLQDGGDKSVITEIQREEEHRLQEAIKQRRQEKVDEQTPTFKRITVKVAGLDVEL